MSVWPGCRFSDRRGCGVRRGETGPGNRIRVRGRRRRTQNVGPTCDGSDMGRMALFDRDGVAGLLAQQNGVITRSQLRSRAMSEAALRHRLRAGGPWQVLLPGVYLSSTGTPTAVQRETAALLYAGPGSAITGPAGLAFHRVRAPDTEVIDVLVPTARRRQDAGFVRLHRTSVLPGMVFPVGSVCYVPPARAVADTYADWPTSARSVPSWRTRCNGAGCRCGSLPRS
jgi:hypothetical protein